MVLFGRKSVSYPYRLFRVKTQINNANTSGIDNRICNDPSMNRFNLQR